MSSYSRINIQLQLNWMDDDKKAKRSTQEESCINIRGCQCNLRDCHNDSFLSLFSRQNLNCTLQRKLVMSLANFRRCIANGATAALCRLTFWLNKRALCCRWRRALAGDFAQELKGPPSANLRIVAQYRP